MHFDLTDLYQERTSPIHHLDPRVKVVLTLIFLIVLSLAPQGAWLVYLWLFLILLLGVALAKLGLTFTLRRSYVALPFALAALPIVFTLEGPSLTTVPGLGWSITQPGLERFITILVRTWLGVQVGIWLSVTTRFPDLLWALSALRIPRVLVAIIGFMYRYLFLMVDQAMRMRQARAARSARVPGAKQPGVAWQGRVAGSMVGSLFLRSVERSERVYAAMASRGYDGEVRTLQRFQMQPFDWFTLITAAIMISGSVAMVGLG